MSPVIDFILLVGWRIWDNVILLQMGDSYMKRFELYASDSNIDLWRSNQQAEWDRLSTTLGLLATMHAVALTIQPSAPPLAHATWLAGSGLSVCGIFIIQYFPIRAYPVPNEALHSLVADQKSVNKALLAAALASPVIITLWASILFAIGILDYIIQTDFGGKKYHILAFIPMCAGISAALATLVIGERANRIVKPSVPAPSPTNRLAPNPEI